MQDNALPLEPAPTVGDAKPAPALPPRLAEPATSASCAPRENDRLYLVLGIALLLFAALASGNRPSIYPVFVDVYYHMAVIEGFQAAGGIVTHAFWEMAPGGRPHIYPPALHALGLLLYDAGISPRAWITFFSWAAYAGCLLTTWLWLQRVFGARPACLALVLLCGPGTFFWNQSVHTSNAAVLVVAPLALLACERGKFLVAALLNFVAISLHPLGLFLPPALGINALLRRGQRLGGLLAATVPVLLYAPWLAHIWALRAFMPEQRTGGDFALTGPGANLGLLMIAGAVCALPAVLRRRGAALSLIGPLVGFAVVIPMGFAGRFLMFNVHWPLACLGGFGLSEVLAWLERRSRSPLPSQVAALSVGVAGLIAFPSLDYRAPPRGPFGPGGPGARGVGLRQARLQLEERSRWRFGIQAAALPQFFDAQPRSGPGPGPKPGGADALHRPGADAFLDAVRAHARRGDVVFVEDPPIASLLTGATGAWTSSGMLRDVRANERPARPEDCAYMVILGVAPRQPILPGPAGPQGPARRLGGPMPPPDFERVFENEFGALWRNPTPPVHARTVEPPVVSRPALVVMLVTGLLLGLVDRIGARRPRVRALAAIGSGLIVMAALMPLAQTALAELRNPPAPPSGRPERPPPRPPPEELRQKHEQVLEAVRQRLETGGNPDVFWPPENEMILRRLIEDGQLREAEQLLDRALERMSNPAAPPP